jgi:hypothetical protein
MGIDAKIMIRIKQAERPSEEQLARWSWDICRSVGASKFFIKDGLPTEAYEPAYKAWHAAFNAHPLAGAWRDNRELHKKIIEDIGPCPEELRRAIRLSRDYSDDDGGEPVGDGKAYFQDGDTIFAADGEWFLEVSLWTRYYGVGYERGDLMTICAVAEWVEANIPTAVVYYGGDSSGVEAEPFNAAAREKLKQHFYSQNGRDYFDHDWFGKGPAPRPAPCGLCIPGEPRFNQHGSGPSFIAVNCAGCGKSFESRDNGATWEIKADD